MTPLHSHRLANLVHDRKTGQNVSQSTEIHHLYKFFIWSLFSFVVFLNLNINFSPLKQFKSALTNDSTVIAENTIYRRSSNILFLMSTNLDLEDLREARDIIRGLYSAAHSLACDNPDCPRAQLFNEPSASTTCNAGASRREDALLRVFLAIVENIGECIDLIRMLVANRNETTRHNHLTQSSTTSRSSTESTESTESATVDSQGCLDEPPIPGLYHDQWTQTPAFSPPAYTAYFHNHLRGFPRAPAPSPAASQTTTLSAESPMTANQEGASRVRQREPGRAVHFRVRNPEVPAGGNGSNHQPRNQFSARVESDSEDSTG